jgi:hypothetical protein
MRPTAIKVSGVGKSYRIGARVEKYRTLRDSLSRAVTAKDQRCKFYEDDAGGISGYRFA